MTTPGKRRNYTPTTVPFRATPVGETLSIAQWAHPMVWTERMLATLQTGVKGGRWHTLIDKVYDQQNLFFSARKVLGKKGAAGVDQQTVEDFMEELRTWTPETGVPHGAAGVDGQSLMDFEKDLKGKLYKIWNRMSSGSYFPPPVRLVEIPKGNTGQT